MIEIEEWSERPSPSDRARRGPSPSHARPDPKPRRTRRTPEFGDDPDDPRIRSPDGRRDPDGPRPEPKLLRHLAHVGRARSDLLRGKAEGRFAPAFVALSAHWRDWRRPPDAWAPPDDAPDLDAQFGSLARHLLADYDVPRVLDAAWHVGPTAEGALQQAWFAHVGRGQNLRTAAGLPIALTKRMAHVLADAPAGLDVPQALRWAQVRGLGGDDELARDVVASRIGTDFARDDFWWTVIRWLIDHPDLDPADRVPIIDHVFRRRYVPTVPNPAGRVRGRARGPLLLPAEPNLTMAGRTPESLLGAIGRRRVGDDGATLRAFDRLEATHGAGRVDIGLHWSPSGIRPLIVEEGEGDRRITYALTELITAGELTEEGEAMNHCVAQYWLRAASGYSSIWSLTAEDASGRVERRLTVEVHLGSRLILQARGRGNRPATDDERDILRRWADAGGPGIARTEEPPAELDEGP